MKPFGQWTLAKFCAKIASLFKGLRDVLHVQPRRPLKNLDVARLGWTWRTSEYHILR